MIDRKQLARAYRETPRPMGVYRVRNLHTGRSLLGRSVDLPAILNRERAQLRLGAHRSAELQEDWNALGAEAFAFEVLDTISPPADQPGYDPADDLAVLHAMWVDRLRGAEAGFYASPGARRAAAAASG